MHRKRWHITILNEEGLQLFSNRIPGYCDALGQLLSRYAGAKCIRAVYEAGYFGFWLYDFLVASGVDACVTPPNLIPCETGNQIKTDRKDSKKLAEYLWKGLLKEVYVPSPEERAHRQVSRRRRQFIQDRIRGQNRIKAELRYTGLELPEEPTGRWSQAFVDKLHAVRFQDPYQQESFQNLLEQYDQVSALIARQTELLKQLSQDPKYKDRVEILVTIPGIGWLAAMEILLELQDVARFRTAEGLAAYVGLTPSQHSSGEFIRLGRITRQGKPMVRALLVQACWRLIEKDPAMQEKYERIKRRAGGKRAIVAVARTLIVRIRRILLDREPYRLGLMEG
jgi:transposase